MPKRAQKRRDPVDHGPPERWQHADSGLEPSGSAGRPYIRAYQDPLDKYYFRGWLCPGNDLESKSKNLRRYEAGARLRKDHELATPLKTPPYDGVAVQVTARSGTVPETAIEAYTRYQEALRAVGKIAADILAPVCCAGIPLSELGGNRIERAGQFKMALDMLAAFYRLPE